VGAFTTKGKDIITIRDEEHWDSGEYCAARTVVLSGDEEWVLNRQMAVELSRQGNRKQRRRAGGFRKEQDIDLELDNQMGATRRLWVQKMLESWVFFDDEGTPIPFVKSGVNKDDDKKASKIMQFFKQDYIDFIYEAIMAAQPKEAQEDEEEGDDEDEEEGSPFFESASISTDGKTDSRALINQDLKNGMRSTETASPRNFLMKS